MTVDELLALTAGDLELFYEATRRRYMGGDSEYDSLPAHVRGLAEPDGGLLAIIQLAHHRTRELERVREQMQQDYTAISAKQQRDAERIHALEATLQKGEWVFAAADVAAAKPTGSGVDRTIVAPGALAKMLADTDTDPPPKLREAIARARQRRENPNG
ncbi:hypothetical protein ACFWU5_16790 [Nocardia sp. NPDC058640]|uniref:hypothetical protein n=1 Tax=Nocardia sp. NPDC058640 TaxID=3346571 RepID=UPI003651F780